MALKMKFRALLWDIAKSCYDMEWYRAVRLMSWKSALRYFFAFLGVFLVAAFIVVTPVFLYVGSQIEPVLQETLQDGSVFVVENGKFRTSMKDPFELHFLGFPVAINTEVEEVNESVIPDRGLLITETHAYYRVGETYSEVYELADWPDMRFTKRNAVGFFADYATQISLMLVLLMLFGHWLLILLNVGIFILITSGIGWVMGRMWRIRLSYTQWLAIGLHAVTLPLLADHVFWFLSIQSEYLFAFIYFMFVIAVITDERMRPTHKV